jgi:hypothetical protein
VYHALSTQYATFFLLFRLDFQKIKYVKIKDKTSLHVNLCFDELRYSLSTYSQVSKIDFMHQNFLFIMLSDRKNNVKSVYHAQKCERNKA